MSKVITKSSVFSVIMNLIGFRLHVYAGVNRSVSGWVMDRESEKKVYYFD